MSICSLLERFVSRVFKTTLRVFLEALRLSPNAQGYVSGSITEFLLKEKLEQEYGMEVLRIREKWEGVKHPRHHGDFYFRRPGSCWYVIESKGLKSNAEKWHKLYNRTNLIRFLASHADKLPWLQEGENVEAQIEAWVDAHLPKFREEFAAPLYEYEEVQQYRLPRRMTAKARAIQKLKGHSREQIQRMIEERLAYVMSRVQVLETHFVSGVSASSQRAIATPRKDEFNVVAVDIVLRYPEHKFLFANPLNLEAPPAYPEHLRQNYVIGFVFFDDEKGQPTLSIGEEWYEDLDEVLATLTEQDCIDERDMQVDTRYQAQEEI